MLKSDFLHIFLRVWKNNPEKVFGATRQWADENPNTLIAITKALIRAGMWLDEKDGSGKYVNRHEAARILSRPEYVGADYEVIKNSMTGYFYFQSTDKRPMPDFNVFFNHFASYPWYSDCVWFLTQMRRWGQIPESKPASWYDETAKKIYRPDIYTAAAEHLIEEGYLQKHQLPAVDEKDKWAGYRPPTDEFIDGNTYDGRSPIKYINSFDVGIREEIK